VDLLHNDFAIEKQGWCWITRSACSHRSTKRVTEK
jgi:hypothetical protein